MDGCALLMLTGNNSCVDNHIPHGQQQENGTLVDQRCAADAWVKQLRDTLQHACWLWQSVGISQACAYIGQHAWSMPMVNTHGHLGIALYVCAAAGLWRPKPKLIAPLVRFLQHSVVCKLNGLSALCMPLVLLCRGRFDTADMYTYLYTIAT